MTIGVIIISIGLICGLAYLLRQRVKRVRKMQADYRDQFADIEEMTEYPVCVFNGKRCIYPRHAKRKLSMNWGRLSG